MQDLGWVEGKNVEYRLGDANGEWDRLDALVGEVIVQKVEVILAVGSQATRAAQRATKTTPIVMMFVSNPVGSGTVASLAKPGGSITGVASQSDVVLGKTIEILHEITPGAGRIAILLNESKPASRSLDRGPERLCRVGPRCASRWGQRANATRRRRRADRSAAIRGRDCVRGRHVLRRARINCKN